MLHGETRRTRARWLRLPFPARRSCSVVYLLLAFAFLFFLFLVPVGTAQQIAEASAWIQPPLTP